MALETLTVSPNSRLCGKTQKHWLVCLTGVLAHKPQGNSHISGSWFFFFCKMINGTSQKCCFTAIFSSVNLSHIPKFLRPKETLALSSLSSSLCYWGSGMYKSLHFFSDVLKINPKVMWPHSALWTRRYCCFLKSSSLWNCYSIFFYFETKVWFFALTDRPPCTFRHHVVAVVLDPSP